MAIVIPTLRHERRLWNDGLQRVVGVDEVGVAPTCGAVVAAAVIMRPGCHRIPGVRDSKTLSIAQRERLDPLIRARAVAVGVGWALARFVFDFTWTAAPWVPLAGAVAGAVLALAAGWWGLREVLLRPVVDTLRRSAE